MAGAPLRFAPAGDGDRSAWLLATKTFCCRNRPFGRFGQQNVLVAKGRRGGRGSRLAKRSGATGEAGSALRRARLDGGAVFGICALVSEPRQSEAGEELLMSRCFFEVRAPGGSTHPQFPRTALRNAGRRRRRSRRMRGSAGLEGYAPSESRRAPLSGQPAPSLRAKRSNPETARAPGSPRRFAPRNDGTSDPASNRRALISTAGAAPRPALRATLPRFAGRGDDPYFAARVRIETASACAAFCASAALSLPNSIASTCCCKASVNSCPPSTTGYGRASGNPAT